VFDLQQEVVIGVILGFNFKPRGGIFFSGATGEPGVF
jgi:hypothetical protein